MPETPSRSPILWPKYGQQKSRNEMTLNPSVRPLTLEEPNRDSKMPRPRNVDVGLRVELCFQSDRAIASLLSVSYFDLLTVQLMQMTYTAIHPLCCKVLKIRILGDSPGWWADTADTAQAGLRKFQQKSKHCDRLDE